MLKHEFSWSYPRHRTFERCHRAYYYHYYASWGGWDEYGFEKSKLLYRLKNLQDLDSWTQSIFRESLKKVFADQKLSEQYLLKTCYFRIRKDFFAMKSPAYEGNQKNKLLKEIFFEGNDVDSICHQAENKIAGFISQLAENPAWQILSTIDPLAVKNIPEPSCFILNGVKIWTRPEFTWSEKGILRIMNLFFHDPLQSEDWAFKATLDMMLVEELFPGDRKIEISSFFMHKNNFPEITISRNRQEVASIIDKSCRRMLELTDLDTNINEELFQMAGGNACECCNFRRACQV